MDERREYPAGVPCWVDLEVADTEAPMRFYGGLFGWEFDDGAQTGAPGPYFVARLGGREVAGMGQRSDGGVSAASWNTYVCVDDLEASLARVRDAGGTITDAAERLPALAHVAAFSDPAGAALRLWQPLRLPGVQRANEPGTWNMNELATTDPDAARAFYAAVLGWEFNPVEYGGQRSWMVRMPGYGDFLTRYDPTIRERQAEAGVPGGYEDAIGWMNEPSAEAGAQASRWGITFAIADTDAIADRAVELGGSVILAPMDIGPDVRLAILADPFGAPFTINRYAGGP